MTRAVLLDASETLFHLHPGFAQLVVMSAETSSELGLEAAATALSAMGRAARWPADQRDPRLRREGWRAFFAEAVSTAGGAPSVDGCQQSADTVMDPDSYVVYPDVAPFLATMSERHPGVALGVVSNFDPWLRDVLDRLRVLEHLSVLSISAETGRVKPDPAAFDHALGALGLPPHEVMFVGDSPRVDVRAAHAAGIRPVLVDRNGIHADQPDAEVITCLTDVPTLLHNPVTRGCTNRPATALEENLPWT